MGNIEYGNRRNMGMGICSWECGIILWECGIVLKEYMGICSWNVGNAGMY